MWMKLTRMIDRQNDLYEERVWNPETNEVVHHQREPLSRHTGDGSARRRR
jgi:hypothetical protein